MKTWSVWLAVTVVAAAIVAAAVWAVPYTERPAFCPTCHEMSPYYEAWSLGSHSDVSCMDCHVEPGTVNHLLHKFVALKEVWVHFTSKPAYPRYAVVVPSRRCTPCHEKIDTPTKPGLSHEEHAKAGRCQDCHPDTGHSVTVGALRAAGILDTAAVTATQTIAARFKTVDGTPQMPRSHKPVKCGLCHDMPRAGCGYCHPTPAGHYAGVCADCHTAGTSFANNVMFAHTGILNCAKCHDAPANHFTGLICRSCHSPKTAFDKTVFRHPSAGEHSYRSFPCADCHPSGFTSTSCTKCHKGGPPTDD